MTSFGLRLEREPGKTPRGIRRNPDGQPKFEVHTFRPCRRIGPDGQELVDVVVEVVQRRAAYLDDEVQRDLDDPTREAVADWHYWIGMGYEF